MGEVTDNHKVVFMFEFVKKVNELTLNVQHESSKCIVRNLGWSIVIERKAVEDEATADFVDSAALAVKLQCQGQSKLWCSFARIRLTLLSQKDGLENYSREFENLFSAMNPTWGYSDFMEWDKVIDPVNGFIKDNVLKFQAHVVADIPQESRTDTSEDMPEEIEDWLALFEDNLNEKIVRRIVSEFIRMNNVIEKALKNDEISEKIIGCAVDPISGVVRSEIQTLEKKLEKFCANQIAKVVRELKNTTQNVTNGPANNDLFDGKSDYESKNNTNGLEASTTKKIHAVEEETVPVSVLKIMKELIVEQQRTSFGSWIPSIYGTRAAYYRTNELHSYQPDSVREAEEFRMQKGVLQPLAYDNSSESFDTSVRQPEDIVPNSESKRENDGQFSGVAHQQLRKNEKKRIEEMLTSNGDEMSAKVPKPTAPNETTPQDSSDKEIIFLGKNMNGEVDVHRIYHNKQLMELKKKYNSYKLLASDEF